MAEKKSSNFSIDDIANDIKEEEIKEPAKATKKIASMKAQKKETKETMSIRLTKKASKNLKTLAKTNGYRSVGAFLTELFENYEDYFKLDEEE